MRPKYVLNEIDTDGCPCEGCVPPVRHSGCHAECSKYIDWDDEHKRLLAEIQHKKDMDDVYSLGVSRRCRNLKRKGLSFGRNKNHNGTGRN